MEHSAHMLGDETYHRFVTEPGTVWVRATPVSEGVAALTVLEQSSAIAAIGKTDEEAAQLPATLRARNRFGTGRMLRIMRTVRDSMPEVKRWVYNRKTGLSQGERSRGGA